MLHATYDTREARQILVDYAQSIGAPETRKRIDAAHKVLMDALKCAAHQRRECLTTC